MPSLFETELAKLNPAQRAAVEQIEGPLLIVAGPGTGKTQTVALRLANILARTQAKPQNLLALTFTEAGAVALKKRLARVIGSSAYGITACTFHSFAAQLAATFPSEFATLRQRQNLDQLAQYKLLTEILKTGKYETLAPLRDTDFYTREIAGRLSILKREGIAPTKLAELVAREEAALPTGDERLNKKTKTVLGRVAAAEKKVAKQKELVQLYAAYQTLLAERSLADFDDLILSVVEKLQPRENASDFLLAYIQEQYLYVTVDEFQDTNGVQSALLAAWASYDDAPNLCAVGDDDQSIYRFQGASLANILEFRAKYPTSATVVLTENYRSTQPILDASGAVITQNHERLVGKIPDLSKDLRAAGRAGGVWPTILECADEVAEAAAVADGVARVLAAGTPAAEVAVLYRNRKQGDLITAALARAGVPVNRTDGSDALADPRVRQLLQLLHAIHSPTDATALLATLLADTSGVPAADAYRLARLADRDSGILDFLTDPELLTKFAAGNAAARLPPIVFHDRAALAQFGNTLLKLLATEATGTLLELAEAAVAESGLAKMVAAKKEFPSAAALATFLDFVRRYVVANPDARLAELLADIKLMQTHGLPLPLATSRVEAVTLATAHGSKGLEWEQVFLTGCHDNPWGGRKKPDILPLPEIVPATATETAEDERRLFYVALTRAKSGLIVSYPQTVAGKEVAPARFLAELPPHVARTQPHVAPERIVALSLPTAELPPLDPESKLFLSSLIEHFRLSATALNSYLSCPRKFLLQSLLRLPGSPDPSDRAGAIFGSAAHRGLEEFFREFQKAGTPPPLDVAVAGVTAALREEPLTRAERTRFETEIVVALTNYLAARPPENPPLFVEQNFGKHDLRLGEIPLTGKVDRIDAVTDDKTAADFIDYKTQQPLSRDAILGKTVNSTGDSYRQLLFYALLARLDTRFIYKVRSLRLEFLRPTATGEFKSESFTPTAAELEELEKTIQQVWAEICELKFDCTDNREGCKKCQLKELCGRG